MFGKLLPLFMPHKNKIDGRPIKSEYALFAGIASLVTVSVLILMKAVAYWYSGSTSVMASLIDSFVDAGVSVMTVFAIQYSLKPADSEHRYGHGKIEGVMALLQAAFIMSAAIFLIFESFIRFIRPIEVVHHHLVYVVLAISIMLSLTLVMIQRYTLKMAPSLAVEADQAHYLNDIVVNLGVMAVLVALSQGAPLWVDPAFSIVLALYISYTVKDIAKRGLDMLLDRELPDEIRKKITDKIVSHKEVMGMHDLRTHKSGMKIFISFDLEVDSSLSLLDAHNIARDIEVDIVASFPNAEVLIHIDPHDDPQDTRHTVSGVHR